MFVVDNDKLNVRELKVGDRMGDRIEILSGVKAGDRVAVTDVGRRRSSSSTALPKVRCCERKR